MHLSVIFFREPRLDVHLPSQILQTTVRKIRNGWIFMDLPGVIFLRLFIRILLLKGDVKVEVSFLD